MIITTRSQIRTDLHLNYSSQFGLVHEMEGLIQKNIFKVLEYLSQLSTHYFWRYVPTTLSIAIKQAN